MSLAFNMNQTLLFPFNSLGSNLLNAASLKANNTTRMRLSANHDPPLFNVRFRVVVVVVVVVVANLFEHTHTHSLTIHSDFIIY